MAEITAPARLDSSYAALLCAAKTDFVADTGSDTDSGTVLSQHGAARIDSSGFPGWPDQLRSANRPANDAIIETFVAGVDSVVPTSGNEPFVSAWQPLADWMNATVRAALTAVGVALAGDAYVTASLTPTALLEGIAHLDDDQFVPTDSVSMVAIIGELVGPRVATGAIDHRPLRAMAPVTFRPDQLDSFTANQMDHCDCPADELVVFPQFGQLHAGPAAHHVADLATTRQLLVMRAKVHIDTT